MIPIIVKYAEELKILQFHSIFKSKNITLSDNNKCAKKTNGLNIYVLADDEPAKTGIHVWRVKVK